VVRAVKQRLMTFALYARQPRTVSVDEGGDTKRGETQMTNIASFRSYRPPTEITRHAACDAQNSTEPGVWLWIANQKITGGQTWRRKIKAVAFRIVPGKFQVQALADHG
jgi:hypothetical protein